MTKNEALRLALEALENMANIRDCQREKGYPLSDADKRMQEAITAIKAALEAKDEPVVWKWHQAPVKTSWGDGMVVSDLAIDKDHTASIYCERDQTTKVEAMFTQPQRTWVGLTNQELADCWDTIPERAMRRVEAKLKEKNT